MNNVVIYSKDYCPYCRSAKRLLTNKGFTYTEYDIGVDDKKLVEMLNRSQRRTVPQIFIDDEHIGGCDDLYDYFDNN